VASVTSISWRLRPLVLLGTAALVLGLTASCAAPSTGVWRTSAPSGASVAPTAAPSEAALPVNPPRDDLPVIDYEPLLVPFPADPEPSSTARIGEGVRPQRRLAVYDAAGGTAKAFLDPTIRGVEVTLPIVESRSGWVGVLLPSANRTIGWLPPGGWATAALPDQLIVVRSTHQLLWYRNDALVRSWSVSLGAKVTPTPLGRSLILGRSSLPGYVYADTMVFALGAVPDDPEAVPVGLRGAHIGIHTWYHDRELGQNTTDGCIRLTKAGQQQLLAELSAGTEVVVVDSLPQPAATPQLG
jgi:hypothetical protein